jgi:hypothetical protein
LSTNLRTVSFSICNSSGKLKSMLESPFWILVCGAAFGF